MIIKITEFNAWENEKWNYFLDTEKQKSVSTNLLLSFIRLNNEQFEKNKKESGQRLFASSKYSIEFFDKLEIDEKGRVVGYQGKTRCIHNGSKNYKSGFTDMNAVISERKMLGARNAIRDKKENRLYKNLEHIFIKTT